MGAVLEHFGLDQVHCVTEANGAISITAQASSSMATFEFDRRIARTFAIAAHF